MSESYFLLLVFFVSFVKNCDNFGIGRCQRMDYMDNFNMTRFTGHWYEIERSFYLMQLITSCITIDIERNDKGQLDVAVLSRSRWSETDAVSEGVATPLRKHPTLFAYKVYSKLPRMVSKYFPGVGVYQVISTDYENYAIIWSCTNYALAHTDFIWIWGRKMEIDANLRMKIYNILAQRQLDSDRLILAKHNCTE